MTTTKVFTEVIEWHRVGDQLPDSERTVLVDFGRRMQMVGADVEAPRTWLGYYTRSDGWVMVDGTTPAITVRRWAEMPKGGV